MTTLPALRGNLFIVVAPSGAGKTSLVNALLSQDDSIKLSVSCTTRAPRPGELDGREYHFLSLEDFMARKEQGEFIEFAQVHGNYYGTSAKMIAESAKSGNDILLEIDWQGARQVKKIFPQALGIFILPPSIEILRERLEKRGQDSQDVIKRRIEAASSEIKHANDCEYVIINDCFDKALSDLAAIVSAARCRFSQQAAQNAVLFSDLGVSLPNVL